MSPLKILIHPFAKFNIDPLRKVQGWEFPAFRLFSLMIKKTRHSKLCKTLMDTLMGPSLA